MLGEFWGNCLWKAPGVKPILDQVWHQIVFTWEEKERQGGRHMQAWKWKSSQHSGDTPEWAVNSLAGGSCLHHTYTDVCVSVCVISFWHYFLHGISVFLFSALKTVFPNEPKWAHWESFSWSKARKKKKWKVHCIRQGDGWYRDKTGMITGHFRHLDVRCFQTEPSHSTAECLCV